MVKSWLSPALVLSVLPALSACPFTLSANMLHPQTSSAFSLTVTTFSPFYRPNSRGAWLPSDPNWVTSASSTVLSKLHQSSVSSLQAGTTTHSFCVSFMSPHTSSTPESLPSPKAVIDEGEKMPELRAPRKRNEKPNRKICRAICDIKHSRDKCA